MHKRIGGFPAFLTFPCLLSTYPTMFSSETEDAHSCTSFAILSFFYRSYNGLLNLFSSCLFERLLWTGVQSCIFKREVIKFLGKD